MKTLFSLLLTFGICFSSSTQTATEYFHRGHAKEKLQGYRGAIADYTKAIEINPRDAVAYAKRGPVKIELGQIDSGSLDLSKAGELGYHKAYDLIRKHCN